MLRTPRSVGVAAVLVSLAMLGRAGAAYAQGGVGPSPDEITAARALFGEALRDEEKNHFAAALEKFQRVAAVKETPAVRYRIGTCYEGLGRRAQAFASYQATVRLGESEPQSLDVVQAARARVDALSKRVARLTLTLSTDAPPEADVRIDGENVGALRDEVPLEPGSHVVTASAPGREPFRSELTLYEGAVASLAIPLNSASPPAQTAPAAETRTQTQAVQDRRSGEPVPASSWRTLGWVALTGGGALLVGSTVVLLVRHAEIVSLNSDCPKGTCPIGVNRDDLNSTQSRALAEGPIGITLGAVGLVAAGLGVYLLATSSPSSSPNAGVTPVAWRDGGAVAAWGTF
jgi:hypothetical protein